MDLIRGVVENLIAGLVGAVLGYFAKIGWDRFKKAQRSKTILDIFNAAHGCTLIIHSATYDESRHAYAFPYCDTKASRIIASLFESIGQKEGIDFKILPDYDLMLADGTIDPTIMNNNLVLICSPKRNRITKLILSKSPNLRYSMEIDKVTGEIILYDEVRHNILSPSSNPHFLDQGSPKPIEKGYDYGMIASMPNPINLTRNVVILAGIHGSGTLGAAMLVGDENFRSELCRRRKNSIIQEVVIAKYEDEVEKIIETSLA